MRTNQSSFMHWAKMRPKVKYDLALSGIFNLPIAELDVNFSEIQLHGDNAYGYAPLTNALAEHRNVAGESVVTVSGGTSMANHLLMAALVQQGDEVLIEKPTYEPILALADYFGARVARFSRRFEENYAIDLDDLARKVSARTRLIILTNLHNPSSVLVERETLRKIGELARTVGAHVMVDEVYLEAVCEGPIASAFELGPEFVVTSSLTKGYGLSGLRCGWIFAAPDLADQIRRLNDIFGAVAPYATEQLSVIALAQLAKIQTRAEAILSANRCALKDFLRTRNDLDVVWSDIGTTLFPKLRTGRAEQLCTRLLESYDTAVVPGHFFESPDHFRIGICCSPETFQAGVKALECALDELRR